MDPSIWIRIQRRQEEYHQRCMEALICGVSKFDYKVIEGTCTRWAVAEAVLNAVAAIRAAESQMEQELLWPSKQEKCEGCGSREWINDTCAYCRSTRS